MDHGSIQRCQDQLERCQFVREGRLIDPRYLFLKLAASPASENNEFDRVGRKGIGQIQNAVFPGSNFDQIEVLSLADPVALHVEWRSAPG